MSFPAEVSADSPPSRAEAALRPGRMLFERYRLEKMVGRGGMGVVWEAHDTRLERPVALKFLPELTFLDIAARDDLKRETRRSLDLTHPHIVRIHDFVEDEHAAAISMEYIDGPTLSHLRVERAQRCFEVEDLRTWTAALCRALDYAHQTASCVHRDLKPSNLMVTSRGILKVADFGIACGLQNTAARVSAWSSTGGTLGYMSPQQLRGELAAPSDDLYSLGATLYELLTSKPPFYSGDLSLQIRDRVPESLAERRRQLGISGAPIDARWEKTIAALLEKDPHDRPRDAREVARLLDLEVTGESGALAGSAEPPTIIQRRSPPPEIAPAPNAERGSASPTTREMPRLRAIASWLGEHRSALTVGLMLAVFAIWFRGQQPLALKPAPAPEAAALAAEIPVAAPVAPAISASEIAAVEAPILESNLAPRSISSAPAIPVPEPADEATTIPPMLEIVTTPARLPFRILRQAYESAAPAEVERRGVTPALIEDLAAGTYRIIFAADGLGERSFAVQLESSGLVRCEQTFAHGILKVASQPAGAEIFVNDEPAGIAPLELALLPGAHEIEARSGERDARPRKITLAADATQTLNFDFRTGPTSAAKARARRPKKPEDTALTKIGRSISKLFGGGDKKK